MIVVVLVAFLALIGIVAVAVDGGNKYETQQMQACVASGGSWTISDQDDSLMECTR